MPEREHLELGVKDMATMPHDVLGMVTMSGYLISCAKLHLNITYS